MAWKEGKLYVSSEKEEWLTLGTVEQFSLTAHQKHEEAVKGLSPHYTILDEVHKPKEKEQEQMSQKEPHVIQDPDWDSYVGQRKAKETVRLKVNAAMERLGIMDHMLIIGESGTGKTTLAEKIAQEHGLPFLSIMVTPDLKIAALNRMILEFIAENEDTGGIIFLDEIHNFDKKKQHYLFSILEGGYLALDNGKKIFFDAPLAFIAATTEEQLLIPPLVRRFNQPIRLQTYTDDEMAEITHRLLRRMDLEPTRKQAFILGQASAGSPAQAGSIAKIARDLKTCDPDLVLRTANITHHGLTVDHLDYLRALRALGGSGGLANITSHSGRSKEITLGVERLLLRLQYIELNKSGRDLTQLGSKALQVADKLAAEEEETTETPFLTQDN